MYKKKTSGEKIIKKTIIFSPDENESMKSIVLIRGGYFLYGKNNQKKYVHSFKIDRTEVSVQNYHMCVTAGKCAAILNKDSMDCNVLNDERKQHPINCVSWDNATKYCHWKQGRLPSSIEWERAARGRKGYVFPWGQQKPSCELVVFKNGREAAGCGKNGTWPVGSKPQGASPDGVLDMAGNVLEWTNTCSSSSSLNANGNCTQRIVRGGSWHSFGSGLQTYNTSSLPVALENPLVGFRCVYSINSKLSTSLPSSQKRQTPPHRR